MILMNFSKDNINLIIIDLETLFVNISIVSVEYWSLPLAVAKDHSVPLNMLSLIFGLHSTMNKDRLNALASLYIHKDMELDSPHSRLFIATWISGDF